MIVKKVRRSPGTRPLRWQIGDLVDYIRFPHNRDPAEKIEHAGSRNLLASTHGGQKKEMIGLAQESSYSKMPVTHWVFSWHEDEAPTRAQVEELVDVFLEQMGLVGHQTIYALHHNTQHYHVHIAVNRMNEQTRKVVRPNGGFDYDPAHKVLAIIEHRQKWEPEKNSRFVVTEDGTLCKRSSKVTAATPPTTKACHLEQRTGLKSAESIAREKALPIIQQANSWTELHTDLAKVGLCFEKKGSGAVIRVGETVVKASTIDRAISMSKLCKRLGDFKPGDYPISPSLPPEPVDAIAQQGMIPEWQAFHAEQLEAESQSDTPPATEASRIFGSLKTQYLAWRRETLPRYKKFGLPMLNIVNHCLKVQYQQVKRVLWQAQKLWRTKSGRLSFEQWLRKKGKTMQANLWHSRTKNPVSLAQTKSTSPSSQGVISSLLPEMEQFVAYANAVDADRYRVTSIRLDQNGDKQAFILDKHNGQSRGFTPQEMAAHMPEMLRLQRRGENIYYTPLSDTKHHILVDDMTQDSLTRFKADGFRPAVILESSPGNFQCLLTIPKLGTPHDRVVGNRLTERLNKKYGDPKLSGCIHPHRAPGFENRKPKHRAPDGTFPPVRLLHAEHCQCDMALEISRTINSECEALASKRKSPVIRASSKSSLPLDPVAAYYAHFDNIKSKLAVEDYSRVDAMIAVRMRATGHLQTSIAYAIQTCAPTIRTTDKTGRNWERYAERTANYAFGPSGDAVLVKYEAHIGHWRRLEGQEMPQEPPVPRMRM